MEIVGIIALAVLVSGLALGALIGILAEIDQAGRSSLTDYVKMAFAGAGLGLLVVLVAFFVAAVFALPIAAVVAAL